MRALLHLDGYGVYVWSAWGLAAAVLAWLVVSSVRTMRARERELAGREAPRARRRRNEGAG